MRVALPIQPAQGDEQEIPVMGSLDGLVALEDNVCKLDLQIFQLE